MSKICMYILGENTFLNKLKAMIIHIKTVSLKEKKIFLFHYSSYYCFEVQNTPMLYLIHN